MKEFVTAARQVEDESHEDIYSYPFKVDGVECRARRPQDGQLAVLMASTSRHSSEQEQVAGLINFFVAVLDKDSHSYVVSKLLDPEDEFGIAEIEAIMEWMVEEWTGRPTVRPSASTKSQKRGGPRSTRSTPALTSSE